MKRVCLISLLCLSPFLSLLSQENFTYIPKTFPVAPNAYEFLKYSEIPVNKYTGIPNISIPVYTIDIGEGDLKIPISLTYHSNGFRVEEESGWTGLGWTLHEGGTITQVVNGYDDFKTIHPNRELPDMDGIIHHASRGGSPADVFTLTKCSGHHVVGLESAIFLLPPSCSIGGLANGYPLFEGNVDKYWHSDGLSDYEPDIFNFRVLGYSGKFVLDWETETFQCLTDPKIKVTKLTETHEKIAITVPDGHIFIFSVKDESIDCTVDMDCYDYNSGNANDSFIGVMSRVYKLDDIYTNKGKHVEYFYKKTGFVKNFPTRSFVLEHDPTSLNNGNTFTNRIVNGIQTHSYVSKIRFDEGFSSIDFEISDRLDLIGAKKLDAIKIQKIRENNQINTIKQFHFNYSYFISAAPESPSFTYKQLTEYTHRLQLNAITEEGKPSTSFHYNSRQLPEKTAINNRDYWGYYTSFHNNSPFPNLHRFNYKREEISEAFFALGQENNRSSRLEDTKAAVLDKITYPTGGHTTFDFELNSFRNYIVPNFEDNNTTVYAPNRINYGAGLRVKEIKSFETNNRLISKKTYTYRGGKLMTPVLFYNKVHIPEASFKTNVTDGFLSAYNRWREKLSTSNFVSPSVNGIGNFVGYDEVVEHLESNEENGESIGSIKSLYENHDNKGVYIDTNVSLLTNQSFQNSGKFAELNLPLYMADKPRNGSLLEEWILDKETNLKKKITNEYHHQWNDYCAFGIRTAKTIYKKLDAQGTCASVNKHLGAYTIRGLYTSLGTTEEIVYLNGEEIQTKSEYGYNDYLQPTEQLTYTSLGDTIRTNKRYTSDLIQYEQDNFLNAPVSTKIYKNDRLIDWIAYTYESRNVPDNFPNSTEAEEPWSLGFGRHHFVNKIRQDVKDREIRFTNTSNGAVLSSQVLGGKVDYYVWGYHERKIIAKIENYVIEGGSSSTYWPDHPQVRAIRNAQTSSDQDDNLETLLSEKILLESLQTLREAFPNAQITTYTYDPLIGVTSITDPRGQTVYYEYDAFNRLEKVKDQDGRVLSKNEYHYKNQER